MAKTAILMPYPELLELAGSLVPEYPRLEPMCIEYVSTSRVRARARALEEKGCELIIARGLQARIARESVVIPVIEMRTSTQELASMILELREKLGSEDGMPPRLGVIGFFNMFHSMDRLGELLNVDLRTYLVTDIHQYESITDRAFEEGCRGVIGGEIVGRRAEALGMAFRFLTMGEESIREGLDNASRVSYVNDLVKRSNAEMETMLGYTFSAIMQVDQGGVIRRANRACYRLLEREAEEIIGRRAREILPALDEAVLRRVMEEGEEVETEVIIIRRTAVMMNIVPIQYDGKIDGAIFTFQEGKRITEMDSRLRQEFYQRGYAARCTFADILAEDGKFRALLDQLKRIARYSAPVLLRGESGVGKGMLAQCIHNDSLQSGGAFVPLDCSVWHPEDLDSMLFGNYSARKSSEKTMTEEARGGTLYLMHVEALPRETQYKLLRLLRGQFLHNGPNQPEAIDVRVIASTDASLRSLAAKGEFRRDLYFALSVLEMEVPPLRERRADVLPWFTRFFTEWQEKYGKHLRLTQDAAALVEDYAWPGNMDQMNSVCERLVLLGKKRSIDAEMLAGHIQLEEHSAPEVAKESGVPDPKAEELIDLLRQWGGNRERAAQALGVSKTTLWRRMKKYGIAKDLTIR